MRTLWIFWTTLMILKVANPCIPIGRPPTPSGAPSPTAAPPPAEAPSPAAATSPTETPSATKATTEYPSPTEAPSPTKLPTAATTNKTEPANKCVTVKGEPCKFPFTYQYKEHTQCLPFQGKHWCALTSIYSKDAWDFCAQDVCPPTMPTGKPTPEEGATTTTTTTTTTSTTETWQEGITRLEIQKEEASFMCKINFMFRLDKGVQIKEPTETCAGLSSASKGDKIDTFGRHIFSLKTSEGIELECEVGAAMLDSNSLSMEVLESSLKCKAVEAECVTVDGPVYPATCVFPFNYNGRRYQACTNRPESTKLWCPTKVSDSEEADEYDWGQCSVKCGFCSGSPIATREGTGQSCGYDCLLGAEWDMVGYDKAPLLKPTITVSKPTQANYIGETVGQHQLNIGPQPVTIYCPETKFYDPALLGLSSVQVKCGPQQYRLTVISESGETLGEEFNNDQFGCDPCPPSYSYVPGFITSKDFSSNGIFYDVQTAADCKTLCEESCACQTFDYSKKHSRCELVKELITKPTLSSSIGDNVLCAKKAEVDNLCGTNAEIDASHLLAEKNWPYLAETLNQVAHPNPQYNTKIFDIVVISSGGNAQVIMTPTNCPVSYPGLVSLFIAPSAAQCNAASLEQPSGKGFHHLMILSSCDLDTAIQNFILDKDKFKQYFGGSLMKLCGSRTWMENVVAVSRKNTLLSVFSFLYNIPASANKFDLDYESDCKTRKETTKTIKHIFDHFDSVGFTNEMFSGTEDDGFIEITLERSSTLNIGVAFVETNILLEENLNVVNMKDIVPYHGLITFPENSDTTSLFITIIQDNISEPDELFKVKLIYEKKGRMFNPENPENPDTIKKTETTGVTKDSPAKPCNDVHNPCPTVLVCFKGNCVKCNADKPCTNEGPNAGLVCFNEKCVECDDMFWGKRCISGKVCNDKKCGWCNVADDKCKQRVLEKCDGNNKKPKCKKMECGNDDQCKEKTIELVIDKKTCTDYCNEEVDKPFPYGKCTEAVFNEDNKQCKITTKDRDTTRCSPEDKCVVCNSDDQCDTDNPVCYKKNNEFKGCRECSRENVKACKDPKKFCYTGREEPSCQICGEHDDCIVEQKIPGIITKEYCLKPENLKNQCVECLKNDHEPCKAKDNGLPFCVSNRCVECLTHADCETEKTKPFCNSEHKCVVMPANKCTEMEEIKTCKARFQETATICDDTEGCVRCTQHYHCTDPKYNYDEENQHYTRCDLNDGLNKNKCYSELGCEGYWYKGDRNYPASPGLVIWMGVGQNIQERVHFHCDEDTLDPVSNKCGTNANQMNVPVDIGYPEHLQKLVNQCKVEWTRVQGQEWKLKEDKYDRTSFFPDKDGYFEFGQDGDVTLPNVFTKTFKHYGSLNACFFKKKE